MKTIKLTQTKIREFALSPTEKSFTVTYSLVDDNGDEWKKVTSNFTEEDLTTSQKGKLNGIIGMVKTFIKTKEQL